MATDPALPDILGAAASRVDRVAEQLLSVAEASLLASVHAGLGWSGRNADIFAADCIKESKELGVAAQIARELAGILRRAAKSASERIYREAQAAEAARQAEAARAKAAASAGKAKSR